MALRERSCNLLIPVLMTGLKKERGREMEVHFHRLVLTNSHTAVAHARHGEKLDQSLDA